MRNRHSDTVQGFCNRYGIDPSTFYRRRDLMPRTIMVGKANRILASDEAEWLQKRREEADRAMSAAA